MTTTQNDKALTKVYTGVNGLRNCGRAIVRILGYEGRSGGWIYNTKGQPITQGYQSLACQYGARYDADLRGWVIPVQGRMRVERILAARTARAEREAAAATA